MDSLPHEYVERDLAILGRVQRCIHCPTYYRPMDMDGLPPDPESECPVRLRAALDKATVLLATERGEGEPRPGWDASRHNDGVRWLREVPHETARLRVLPIHGAWEWRFDRLRGMTGYGLTWVTQKSGVERYALDAIDAVERGLE